VLRLPSFTFRSPTSIDEATRILAGEGSEARVVAGGTDLWPNMKRRHQKAATVASLMRIPELRGIECGEDGLALGATATLAEILEHRALRSRYPMLATAVVAISSPPLRNMGTIGGNVLLDTRCTYYNQTEEWRRSIDYCLKEAGSVCWVAPGSSLCWAHSASDAAPALCALGASATLASSGGERQLPIEDLYGDDGIDYLTKRPDEILVRLQVPAAAAADSCRAAFWKLRRRGSIDFAVLSVAAALWADPDGTVTRARLFLGAVASRPLRVPDAEAALVGHRPDPERLAAAARLARRAATPLDNTDFLPQWRGVMTERYTLAALGEAAGLPIEGFEPPHRRFTND
jgi:4-hydroxybenzoyl-CoA reductase subunit beta